MLPACRFAASIALLSTFAAGAEPERPAAPPAPQPTTYLARLAAARIPANAAAVIVKPLDGGTLGWSANDRKPMNPASTMKLVTTYSALHLLGPAFTFRTEIYADGPWSADSLRGDRTCAAAAIRSSSSKTCGCSSTVCAASASARSAATWCSTRRCFDPLRHDPAQFDGEEGRAYNVGPDALLVNFKSIALTFVPDPAAQVARVIVVPEVAGMKCAKHRARRRRRLRRLARRDCAPTSTTR